MHYLWAVAALAFSCTSAQALNRRCDAPVEEWKPRSLLQSKLEHDGWQVESIHAENGCYDAHAINSTGHKVKAYFDPKSLEAVGVQQDD